MHSVKEMRKNDSTLTRSISKLTKMILVKFRFSYGNHKVARLIKIRLLAYQLRVW
jgi:hypothetical protein